MVVLNDDMIRTETPIVHESQSRQLCAVHTINNLLQLSCNDECNAVEGKVSSVQYCTKLELDTIADELTLAEKRLLSTVEEDDHKQLSALDLIFSKHRTIWFGNYSIEVGGISFDCTSKKILRIILTQNSYYFLQRLFKKLYGGGMFI